MISHQQGQIKNLEAEKSLKRESFPKSVLNAESSLTLFQYKRRQIDYNGNSNDSSSQTTHDHSSSALTIIDSANKNFLVKDTGQEAEQVATMVPESYKLLQWYLKSTNCYNGA